MKKKEDIKPITENQKMMLLHGFKTKGISKEAFMDAFMIKSLDEISQEGASKMFEKFDLLVSEIIEAKKDELSIENGKYIFHTENNMLKCRRYGIPWRDFCGDKAIYCLYYECLEQRKILDIIKQKITTIKMNACENLNIDQNNLINEIFNMIEIK